MYSDSVPLLFFLPLCLVMPTNFSAMFSEWYSTHHVWMALLPRDCVIFLQLTLELMHHFGINVGQ